MNPGADKSTREESAREESIEDRTFSSTDMNWRKSLHSLTPLERKPNSVYAMRVSNVLSPKLVFRPHERSCIIADQENKVIVQTASDYVIYYLDSV